MRKQIAHQTFLTLLAWLVFGNFNIAAAGLHGLELPLPFGNYGGKGIESPYSLSVKDHAACTTVPAYRIHKVVLDAGHGGKDPGCIGAISREKHNALAIVLRLGALIKEEYPDVEVIYTRDSDVFIELNERAAIANRNNADLFVSVHCNSVSASHIKGAETYVMGLHTADHNLEVAKRENAAIFLEDNYQKNYGGYDPNSPEAHILGSVWQSAYLEQSILFAGLVQNYSKKLANREDRGVKQAGFLVLRETAMPSVLVEAGFLTNRTEESFIASEEGQSQMADAIFEAFRAYKAQMEGVPLAARKAGKPQLAAKGTQTPKAVATSLKTPVTTDKATKNTGTAAIADPAPPLPATPTATNLYADEIPLTIPGQSAGGPYRIHLMSWKSRLDRNAGQLSLLSEVTEEQYGGEFHYFTGTFATRAEAEKMLPELFNLGFRTARILSPKATK